MSNRLTIARVRLQDVSSTGQAEGPPRFAVQAGDNYEDNTTSSRDSLAELNEDIRHAGGLLQFVQDECDDAFCNMDITDVGFENFEGDVLDRKGSAPL